MRKSILYIIVAISFLYGCKREPLTDCPYSCYYQYINKLETTVSLECYDTQNESVKTKTITLQKNQSHGEEEGLLLEPEEIYIKDCDSVRIVFGDTKELWYFSHKGPTKPRNIMWVSQYKVTKNTACQKTYEYDIDEEVYALATDIE